jgi:hypothetical protein
MSTGEDEALRQDLDRLTAECCVIGSEWEAAASRLIKREALPSAELMEQLDRLRRGWDSLLAAASKAHVATDGAILAPPDPMRSLTDAVVFVEEAIETFRRRAGWAAVLALVLDRLDRVMRLEARNVQAIPGLTELHDEASELAWRVREATDPGAPADFAPIAEGSHRYCHLLALVEPADGPDYEREGHLIECAASFGREITKAAAHGQLVLAPGTDRHAPATKGSTAPLPAPDRSPPWAYGPPPRRSSRSRLRHRSSRLPLGRDRPHALARTWGPQSSRRRSVPIHFHGRSQSPRHSRPLPNQCATRTRGSPRSRSISTAPIPVLSCLSRRSRP